MNCVVYLFIMPFFFYSSCVSLCSQLNVGQRLSWCGTTLDTSTRCSSSLLINISTLDSPGKRNCVGYIFPGVWRIYFIYLLQLNSAYKGNIYIEELPYVLKSCTVWLNLLFSLGFRRDVSILGPQVSLCHVFRWLNYLNVTNNSAVLRLRPAVHGFSVFVAAPFLYCSFHHIPSKSAWQ